KNSRSRAQTLTRRPAHQTGQTGFCTTKSPTRTPRPLPLARVQPNRQTVAANFCYAFSKGAPANLERLFYSAQSASKRLRQCPLKGACELPVPFFVVRSVPTNSTPALAPVRMVSDSK